ncbi:MAG: hypothetical protein J6B93_03430 [Clostridia bacterium]|nr:hypothetical protein [Clostridia bacterium]
MKRIAALVLSLIICLTICTPTGMTVQGTATSINGVYSDEFTGNSLANSWAFMAEENVTTDGRAYTSTVENGKLKVITQKQTRSAYAGCIYLPEMERENQRIAVEFSDEDLAKGNTAYVYGRLSRPGDWTTMAGYYALYRPSNGKVMLHKINGTADNNNPLLQCGVSAQQEGMSYRLEMVISGDKAAAITVNLYTLDGDTEKLVVTGTYLDTEAPYLKGTAGIGVSGSSTSPEDYAYIESFTYTSTDKVTGNPKYLANNNAVSNVTFGQTIALEKGVEYVFGAYGTVDTKDNSGYKNEPLWVEYQTGSSKTSNTTTRLSSVRGSIQKTCDLTEAQCKEANLEYGPYNLSYVTFTAGGDDACSIEENGYRVRHIVGVRINSSTALVGNYSNFFLYKKGDTTRTNLLVNPNFDMGLYGWADGPKFFGGTVGKEDSATVSAGGYGTVLSDKNNFDYYEHFKNPAYIALDYDANGDTLFDIRDLVYMNVSKDYYYISDTNKNGSVDAEDAANFRTALLNDTIGEGLRAVQKIARIGYRPYDSNTPPQQSLASYRMAYEKGYKILLCDVRLTSDGHFVALHDKTINSYATNSEGKRITNDEAINIADITLAQADTYDFGVYKGQQYKGTKIMRVEEFLALCKELEVVPHLELKVDLTEDKLDELVALIDLYGHKDNLMINGQTAADLVYLADKLPKAAMGTWVQKITDTLISQIATYGENNPKFIYVSNGGESYITEENYLKCKEKGIDIAYTEIRSEDELKSFRLMGLWKYCKYAATRYDLDY